MFGFEEPAGDSLVFVRGLLGCFFCFYYIPSCQLIWKNNQFFCLEMCGVNADADTAHNFRDCTNAVKQDTVISYTVPEQTYLQVLSLCASVKRS